jgi:putative phosphoribosyl transferase
LPIVGGADVRVIALNREALDRLRCEKRLEILPGATHLFEEPGALEEVARLARQWFKRYLATDVAIRSGGEVRTGARTGVEREVAPHKPA